jgi:lipoprotein-releasing system permease protein
LNEVDYYLAYAPVRLELWPLLAINAGALLLTLLFLLLPSLAVSNIAPVRAIRFK